MGMDGRTDMTKLRVAFRSFAKTSVKYQRVPPIFLRKFVSSVLLRCVEWYNTRGIQKVKAIFKLRGNRDREELAHCAVLTTPIEEFSHVQYSALPSVEWQQRG